MESSHGWLFPWCALFGGGASVIFAPARSGLLSRRPSVAWSKGAFAAWLVLAALAVFVMIRLGRSLGSDFIPARGLLLGALSGALTVWFAAECASSAPPEGPPGILTGLNPAARALTCFAPLFLGLGTVTVAAARLWLTHSEIAGLTALPLGFAVSAVMLTPRSREAAGAAQYRVGGAMVFVAILALSTALGFTRAGELEERVWADLPLLLAAAISLGALIGSTLAGAWSWAPTAATGFLTAAAALVLSRGLIHSWRLFALAIAAVLVFALLIPLSRSGREAEDGAEGDAGLLCGLLIVVMGNVLAFSIWSGYGAAIFNLCACAVAAWRYPATLTRIHEPAASTPSIVLSVERAASSSASLLVLGSLAFGAALLVHRVLLLSTEADVRASGMGSTWTLLSIAVGVIAPMAAGSWLSRDSRRTPWLPGSEAILALIGAAILAGYAWGGRFVGGVLIGAALSPLLAAVRLPNVRRLAGTAVAALTLGLVQIQIQPWLHTLPDPVRKVRASIVLFAAAVLLVRILIGTAISARDGRKA